MSTLIFSGGATGADDLWVQCASHHGCDIEIMSFEGHERTVRFPCTVREISSDDLHSVVDTVLLTGTALKRFIDMRPSVYNLIARNYFIVRDAEVVFAVGYLNQKTGLGIDGGTAWGCEYFTQMRGSEARIYFFDMCTATWMVLQHGESWVPCDAVPSPLSFKRVALIGSRELTESGKIAIQGVWGRETVVTLISE